MAKATQPMPDFEELRRRAAASQQPIPAAPAVAPAIPPPIPEPVTAGISTAPTAPAPPAEMQPLAKPMAARPLPESPDLQALRQRHQELATSPSGVAGIKHAALRIPAQIGDALLSGFFPGVAMALPGTTLHHQYLVNQAAHALNTGEQAESAAARRGVEAQQGEEAAARIPLLESQSKEAQARAESLLHPPPKTGEIGKTIETDEGIMELNPSTGRYDIPVGNAPGKDQQNVHVLPDGSVVAVHHDPKTGKSSAEVVYKGDPSVKTHIANLEVSGKPHSVLVNTDTGETIKDLGPTGEKPPTVNVNAGIAALDRESARFAKGHEKSIADANSQLEKIADARAMINGSAEAQALGIPKILTALVSGQGSGVRITQPELNAIAKARGVVGDVQGFLSSILGQGKLTGTQKQQLTQILDDVHARILQKQGIANEALDRINSGASREEIIRADKEARQKLSDLEKGGGLSTASDPAVKAYADKYFGGDVAKAQKAIEEQRGRK